MPEGSPASVWQYWSVYMLPPVRALDFVLRSRPLVWLGEVSFAFYMVHLILLNVVRELIGPEKFFGTAAGIGVLVLEALATLAVAWLLYVAVEKPAMRHLGRTRKANTA
ncbi:hypothetical protein OV450_3588 [Actinobacteria bacterium OV450]|nr:hypothetical protein OV450_3588 [Actinobacteria bacterium OV450]